MQPCFPVYIPSKGRWEQRLTSRALTRMGVPYRLIVEEQQHDAYARALGSDENLLVLPCSYQETYDTCDSLGPSKSVGPGPARNFAWNHSMERGHPWHWVMDDNIRGFYRLNQNRKVPLGDGTGFRVMEDFALRYTNLGMAGPNYVFFAKRKQKLRPVILNTRIYSCNLIRNDTPFRWRARYNEDTDLSLRMLKAGWCTAQFNAFLQQKVATQSMSGGNTDEFYAREGTYAKSRMQVDLHPDVSRMIWRFGRVHHYVDYRPFRGLKLQRRDDAPAVDGVNEYGLRVVDRGATRVERAV